MASNLWTIVLAAGKGTRLASVTGGVPKQFWNADGGPTLLEDTLERTARLSPPDRTVIVVDRSHGKFVRELPELDSFEHLLYQSGDRGTATGVLLGLTEVLAADAEASVLLVPSDHGIQEPDHFVNGIAAAGDRVGAGRHEVILFGVLPSTPERDYGWILPAGQAAVDGLVPVASFVEKPDAATATRLFESGAVWNTMVLVSRAATLLKLYCRHLPDVADAFIYSLRFNRPARQEFLRAQYEMLPSTDFSRDLLGHATRLFLQTWPAEMGWSDLGTPDRLARWCAHRPNDYSPARPLRGHRLERQSTEAGLPAV
jgi:mannose-1-phosphate guanylyltransferase